MGNFFSFSLKKLDSDQCGGTWCHQDEKSSSFWKVATWQKAFRQHEAKNSWPQIWSYWIEMNKNRRRKKKLREMQKNLLGGFKLKKGRNPILKSWILTRTLIPKRITLYPYSPTSTTAARITALRVFNGSQLCVTSHFLALFKSTFFQKKFHGHSKKTSDKVFALFHFDLFLLSLRSRFWASPLELVYSNQVTLGMRVSSRIIRNSAMRVEAIQGNHGVKITFKMNKLVDESGAIETRA